MASSTPPERMASPRGTGLILARSSSTDETSNEDTVGHLPCLCHQVESDSDPEAPFSNPVSVDFTPGSVGSEFPVRRCEIPGLQQAWAER